MKKILFVNNYDMSKSRKFFLENKSPSQHLFGTNELIETGEYEVSYMLAAPKNYKSKILKLISLIPVWINIYFEARKFNYIYGGADFTIDFLEFLKKIGVFKPKLITIFHHPPFNLRLKYERYDKVLFLSEYSYHEMCKRFPNLKTTFEFLQWGPDLNFYQRFSATPNFKINSDEIIFISNGKTQRDHESLVIAAEKSQNRTIIVSDSQSVPPNYEKNNKYVEIYHQEEPNDKNMVKLLNKCSVLIIPTHYTKHRLGPIGLTSFLDAVALGMPIITASNTSFSDAVLQYKMGLIYTAGNAKELEEKMNILKNNKDLVIEFGTNAYNFGQNNNMKAFGEKLYKILEHI